MFDAFLQDLRYALRTLRSSPGFASVAILSLALGIGANTAIFSLIDSVMLKYLPVRHPEELLNVTLGDSVSWTNPIWEQVRDHQDVFSGLFAYGTLRFNLASGGEARYAQGIWASGDFFSTLGVRTSLGRTFTRLDDRRGCPGGAVLSYDFWQKEYGGSAAVLDKTISLDGHPFPVLGVTEPGFFGMEVGRAFDVAVPVCTEAIMRGSGSQLDQRSSWWLRVIGRPKEGLDARQVTARLKTLAPGVFTATVPQNWPENSQEEYRHRTFETLPAANGLSSLRAQYRLALLTLMGMVGVVLLIACANVANLLLARATVRQKEIAIRLALGSGRGRLIRQLMTESVLLSLAGAALGVLFAKWGSRILVRFLGNQVILDLAVDARVLAFTIGVALLTGLLFGLAPAWRGTRVQPQTAMKTNARGIAEGHSRFSLSKALVMVQVALSLVLLVGAGLMLETFQKLAALDAGFERHGVLLVNVDLRNGHYPKERLAAAYDEMLEHLRAIPGVRSASLSSNTPVSGNTSNNLIAVDGYVPKSPRDTLVWMNRVSPRYFETLGTPILAGRDFNTHDTSGSPKVAIVNESMAKKFFAKTNPIGQHYRYTFPTLGPPIEIVGVVKDAKYRNLREQSSGTAYVPASQEEYGMYLSFELRSAGPENSVSDLIPSVRTAMEQVNRDVTLEFRTLAVQVAESLLRERLLATLGGFFGGLALLLATLGLYGVMSYNVARRRNEIGIRIALGAEQARVLRMVFGEVAFLVGVGLLSGLAVAVATTRIVASFLYGLTATDPLTIMLASGVLATVAAVAGFLPARRASRLDPMASLREE